MIKIEKYFRKIHEKFLLGKNFSPPGGNSKFHWFSKVFPPGGIGRKFRVIKRLIALLINITLLNILLSYIIDKEQALLYEKIGV